MILGITGGVGTGKSTILNYLREKYGAYLISCDDVARQLQQPEEECYGPMLELFQNTKIRYADMDPDSDGNRDTENLLNKDGSFNRSVIARKVFADVELLKALNRIVHPAVKRRVRELIDSYIQTYNNIQSDSCPYFYRDSKIDAYKKGNKESNNGIPLIVIEAALLLEDNYGEICDEIWYVRADEDVRRERLRKSRGYSDEKIDSIFASQRADESYRECCSVTIDNSSENVQNTFRQLDEALASRGIIPADSDRSTD